MKKLLVSIKLEMEVPDHWMLEKTDDGVEVLNIGGGKYMDLSPEPLVTDDKNGTWATDYDDSFANEILDMYRSEDVAYKLLDE